ncbi:MAG: TetR/AcrR family transcriptional regulator [Gammaproteobacteria bacterium]|nr:TetR/AcrR family transcriptional regulator [Gammaproteobacteria bacterium]
MRGRPRKFDRSAVLKTVRETFWLTGYAGTNYALLCERTGLNKPSLYNAFGSKDALFLEALESYIALGVQPSIERLNAVQNVRTAIQMLLEDTVKALTDEQTPAGCFLANNLTFAQNDEVPDAITTALENGVALTPAAILNRLESVEPNVLPSGVSARELAVYFETLIAGLSAMAREGAAQSDLLKVVDLAMQFWPES